MSPSMTWSCIVSVSVTNLRNSSVMECRKSATLRKFKIFSKVLVNGPVSYFLFLISEFLYLKHLTSLTICRFLLQISQHSKNRLSLILIEFLHVQSKKNNIAAVTNTEKCPVMEVIRGDTQYDTNFTKFGHYDQVRDQLEVNLLLVPEWQPFYVQDWEMFFLRILPYHLSTFQEIVSSNLGVI